MSQLDIAASLRFNNDLSLVTLSREELVGALEHAVAASAPDVTAGQFAQVSGIRYSFDWTQPEGERLESAAIVDDNGEMVDVLMANGQLVGDAGGDVRVVTLGFLADGGDGYPLGDGINDDRVDLIEADIAKGEASFADTGTEQDAFAEYLQAMHGETPFGENETPASEDTRIQNLAERDDAVLVGSVDSVLRLYDAAFDRDADGTGLSYWLESNQQLSLQEIADSFVSSKEYMSLYGETNHGAYVDRLYTNVLEREADAEGRAYWIEQLQAGDSEGAVMVGFTESEESLMLAG